MAKLTHLPKTVTGPDGKPRVVYARTPETDREMENFRLGPLADLKPLVRSQAPELFKNIREKALIIQAPYPLARQIIRTRLEIDRSAHRVLNGTVLFQHHFFATDSCREGFPQFKQFYMMFGYVELSNKLHHQVVCENMFTRYESGLHFWLLIPKTLGEMAAQWGDAFMNFQVFPSIRLNSLEESNFSPTSVACPTFSSGKYEQSRRKDTDPDSSEGGSTEDSGGITEGDIKFAAKKRKHWNRGGF